MSDMILYISVITAGYFIGSKFRGHEKKLSWRGGVQTIAIMTLVVLMGARMGCNEQVVNNIGTIGITALVMTLSIIFFSVCALYLARKAVGFDKEATLHNKKGGVTVEETVEIIGDGKEYKGDGINKMTIIIFASVIVGMALGYLIARPVFGDEIESFDHAASLGIKIGLCFLMIFVGLELGIQGNIFDIMRESGLRILLFPAVTIIGTFVGAWVSGLLLNFSLRESMAVGAGFGWYSLAPGIIMDAGLIEASAVSFLHNVLREVIGILLLPIVSQKIGYIEAACMSGAPAMDVCLPVISKETHGKAVPYGFVTGVIMSFLVPVSVPLALSIF